MAARGTIRSLQAGRGIAALAVVVSHSALAARDFGGTDWPFLSYGWLGVDFFFVLSGFIIFHSTAGTGKTLRSYVLARFRRIYLPYWPVGIGIALLYLALPGISEGARSWSWLPTLTLAPVNSSTALSVAWTLKHEILFYLLFGIAWFGGFLRPAMILWAILIAAATVAGIDTVALQPINLEFLFGMLACMAVRSGRAHPLLLIGTIGCFALWIIFGASRELSFLVGMGIAFAIPPLVAAEWRGKLAVAASLVLLGDASYALYLTHPLVTPAIARLLAGHGPAILILSILTAIVVGIAYHLLVERPLLGRRSFLRPARHQVDHLVAAGDPIADDRA
jgi:peptidoglycan/LPS O-acetylase OafA/YrhL